jgi:LacI family transcriptional regulator
MSSRRVTMRDVARSLGIDPSTVSLALRNHPRIPIATRERIRRVAEELGYIPDPMLGALANYRRFSHPAPITAEVAWINRWDPPERYYSFREFNNYWVGASAAANELGYSLERFHLGNAPLSRITRVLRARNIRGVLVPPHYGACNDWAGFACDQLAVVRMGHTVQLAAHAVGCDQTEAAILGFRSIHERGYRRIGFVTHAGAEVSSRFRAGFLFAQENTPDIDCVPTLLLDEAKPQTANRLPLANWMRCYRPDAIFTTYARVRELLGEIGYRVPDDVALAATSVLDGNADAGIDQCSEEIGRAAVQMLGGLVACGWLGLPAIPRMTMIRARWVEGESLPWRSIE